jgi:hypothetical protein
MSLFARSFLIWAVGDTTHFNSRNHVFCFHTFPGFKCILTALKSRTVAPKTRTKASATAIRIAGVPQAAYMTPAASGFAPNIAERFAPLSDRSDRQSGAL